MAHIRAYAHPNDWTESLSDQVMTRLIERYILESQMLKRECAAYDLAFVDTSHDFLHTLDHFYQQIIG